MEKSQVYILVSILILVILAFFIYKKMSLKTEEVSAISKEQASVIAQNFISKNNSGLVILDDKTITKEYGWIFFYTSKKYLETGDKKYLIPGNGPLVIKNDGSVHTLTSAMPPTEAIAQYEESLR